MAVRERDRWMSGEEERAFGAFKKILSGARSTLVFSSLSESSRVRVPAMSSALCIQTGLQSENTCVTGPVAPWEELCRPVTIH